MKPVRLFLSSPGDVRDERNLARRVVEQLNSERAFVTRVVVEIVAYDQPGAGVVMEAALTPYEGVPADGSAWLETGGGTCSPRVLRGGSWADFRNGLRSATRAWVSRGLGNTNVEFRLAQDSS